MKRLVLLVFLMLSCAFFGWRANITFEPNPIRYVPIPVRQTLAWDMNSWTTNR